MKTTTGRDDGRTRLAGEAVAAAQNARAAPTAGPRNRDELEALRAKAFAIWGSGPTAVSQAYFDDAFQEGWVGLEQTLASGRPVDNWQGYLIESGRNWLHRRQRRANRTPALPQQERPLADYRAAERFEEVEEEAERLQWTAAVRRVLAEEFDEREQQMIKLKYELQRSDREIARMFDISPRAVKTHFSGKRKQGRLKQEGINQRLARYVGSPPDESLLCRRRRSQVKALVGGWAMSDRRKAQVRTHLEACEGCRVFAHRTLGYQLLLPPITLPVALAGHQPGGETLAQMARIVHDAVDKVDAAPASGLAAATGGSVAAAAGAGGSAAAGAAGGASLLTSGLGAKLAVGCAIAGGTVCVGAYDEIVARPGEKRTETRARAPQRAGPATATGPVTPAPSPAPARTRTQADSAPDRSPQPPAQPPPVAAAPSAAAEFDVSGEVVAAKPAPTAQARRSTRPPPPPPSPAQHEFGGP